METKPSRLEEHLSKKETAPEGDYEAFIVKVAELLKKIDPAKIKGERGETGKDAPPIDERRLAEKISLLVRVPKDGTDGMPGKDADEEAILRSLVRFIPAPKAGRDGKDGQKGKDGMDAELPDLRELAINTINVLESFEGDNRLDASAIKGIKRYVLGFINESWGGPGIVFHDSTLTGSGVPQDPLSVVNTGGGGNFTDNEVVAGVGTTWTLVSVPILNSVHLYANGQRLIPTIDYTISGAIITTVLSWAVSTILADYRTS